MADRLDIVSVERVNDELERLLAVERPRAGFDFLVATGLLRRVLPGFDQLEGVDVERAVALASTPPPTPALPPASSRAGQPPGPDEVTVRRAGLLWPIRARAGEHLARLRYSRAESDRTLNLLAGTEQGLARRPDRPTVRRIAALTGPVDLQLVKVLAANLAEVHPGIEAEGLGDLIDELSRGEDLGRLDGPLTGAEIMDLLAIGPGPEVGRAQRHLRELRLDQGPIEPDQARVELLRWWRQEPGGRSSLP
jgi:poly(A) polymerase